MEDLISVIVPVYNNIKDLERCLTSIKNQTYGNFECLLIDDGSTDGSGEYLDNFSKSDDRFKVFHKENGGVSSARNFGLDRISGEWLTFIDSDDEVMPDYIKVLYESATKYGCEYALCGFHSFTDIKGRDDYVNNYKPDGEVKIIDLTAISKKDVQIFRFGAICGQLYKTELLGNNRFLKDVWLSEDLIFNSGMLIGVKKLAVVPYKLYLYNQCGGAGASLSRTTDGSKHFSRVGKLQIVYKQFKGKNKALYKFYRYLYTKLCFRDITTVEFYDELMKHKKFLVRELRKNVFYYLFNKDELKTKILYLAICIAPQLVINKLRKNILANEEH